MTYTDEEQAIYDRGLNDGRRHGRTEGFLESMDAMNEALRIRLRDARAVERKLDGRNGLHRFRYLIAFSICLISALFIGMDVSRFGEAPVWMGYLILSLVVWGALLVRLLWRMGR
jgi:hypothetical protein